ncbi:uncharacterized protein [Ptychodera flava]|uniref:uncharacterized protein n=1 Tax=Ptychodera flava TaxID=63121 RepID=UPI00396A9248
MWMCKTVQVTDAPPLPAWTGFNRATAKSIAPPITKIGYLPVIDASPTEMSTVNTVLVKSIDVINKLNLPSGVLVMDQAIYSKAQQIRWQNQEFESRLVLRLGEFHTAMSFMAVIGKQYKDAGLEDLMIESGVSAQGSVNGVMSGHHYNRSIRCHKLVAEAMHRLRFSEFLDSLPEAEYLGALDCLIRLRESFPEDFSDEAKSDHVKMLQAKYKAHLEERSRSNANYAFWNSYLEMVQVLLLFIRATREGGWELHLSVLRDMLPWYFAYGRVNYSRYLPVYLQEMSALKVTIQVCMKNSAKVNLPFSGQIVRLP